MSKIIPLNETTTMDIPPDRVLENAVGKLKSVIVLGYDQDGYEYFASSTSEYGDLLLLLERAKLTLLMQYVE